MRVFVDEDARHWDIVVGRESWGALFALFIPAGGDEGIRQTMLQSASYEDATRLLQHAEEAELADLFQRSEPKRLD